MKTEYTIYIKTIGDAWINPINYPNIIIEPKTKACALKRGQVSIPLHIIGNYSDGLEKLKELNTH